MDHSSAVAPPIVSVEHVLAGIPRGARVLCLELAGPAALICRGLTERTGDELPWLLDRHPVTSRDVEQRGYRKQDVGLARDRALCADIARRTGRALPLGQGSHPESELVHRVCRERRRREQVITELLGRDGQPFWPGQVPAELDPTTTPGAPRRTARDPGWLSGLVARFDRVVQTVDAHEEEHWEPPLAPGTPVLQLVLDVAGDLRAVEGAERTVPWWARRCRDCQLAAIRVEADPDCLCRLALHPEIREIRAG